MSTKHNISLQADVRRDMKRDAKSAFHVLLTAVLLAIFLQVPIFYGLVKLSIVSCNVTPTSLSTSVYALSSKRIRNSTSDQKTDVGRSSELNKKFAGRAADSASDFTRAKKKPSLRPHGHAHYPFVQFSAYRQSPRAFFVVGITSVVARSFDLPVYKCEWWPSSSDASEPSNASSITDANMIYVYFDQMPRIYVVATVNCTFEEDNVGIDENGGSLFMTVSVGPHHGDSEKVLALQEHKGEAKEVLGARDQPLPLKFAFCGPPMHGSNIRAEWVLHWLVYHHSMWGDSVHFFFYNVGAITDSFRQIIRPFLEKGLITILDVEDEKEYPSWYFNQLLFINDCLHRTRYLSSWTFFHDFDEFLAIPSPKITLDNLLEQHKDAPFVSFGSVRTSLWMCEDVHPGSSDQWPLQRMRWIEKQPYCCLPDQDPWLCIHGEGARKYAVNPRKVFAGGVHSTAIPGEGAGVNLNASIARLIHYRGMLSNSTSSCSSTFNVSTPLEVLHQIAPASQLYVRDDYISIQVGKARDLYAKWQVGS